MPDRTASPWWIRGRQASASGRCAIGPGAESAHQRAVEKRGQSFVRGERAGLLARSVGRRGRRRGAPSVETNVCRKRTRTVQCMAGLPATPRRRHRTTRPATNDETVFPVPLSSSDCIIACSSGLAPDPIFASARNPRTTSRRLLYDSSSRIRAKRTAEAAVDVKA